MYTLTSRQHQRRSAPPRGPAFARFRRLDRAVRRRRRGGRLSERVFCQMRTGLLQHSASRLMPSARRSSITDSFSPTVQVGIRVHSIIDHNFGLLSGRSGTAPRASGERRAPGRLNARTERQGDRAGRATGSDRRCYEGASIAIRIKMAPTR